MKVLITGGLGCIGSETAKWLLANTEAELIITSRDTSQERIKRVFHEVDHSRASVRQLDICSLDALKQLFVSEEVTHVVHLAALQTPDCNAHRDLGLQINLAGTQHLIEAMKAEGKAVERFIFASSIAVYGPRASYPSGIVPMLATPDPVNVYGAWKLAGEQISKFFWQDTGVSTICVRPGVLFGPGRDAGLTSSPTTAMKAIALGRSYEIPFKSTQDYLYAPDVGAALGHALTDAFSGYGQFTLPSHTVDTSAMVAAMRQASVELGITGEFAITIGTDSVPFICDLDFEPFVKAFPQVPHTDLNQAVRESIQVFQKQVSLGWLNR